MAELRKQELHEKLEEMRAVRAAAADEQERVQREQQAILEQKQVFFSVVL